MSARTTSQPSRVPAAGRALLAILALVVTAAVATPAHAESQEGDAVLSLSFEGGSVADYLTALRAERPTLNIVAFGNLGAIPMPAVELFQVHPHQAVDLLDHHGGIVEDEQLGIQVRHRPDEHGADLWTVQARRMGRIAEPPRPAPVRSAIWQVGPILESGMAADDLISAIEAALDLGRAGECKVAFHAETGLLMARGAAEDLGVIDDAVDALEDAPSPAKQQIEKLRSELEQSRVSQSNTAAALSRTKAEVDEQRVRVAEQEARLEAARRENAHLRDRITEVLEQLQVEIATRTQLQQQLASIEQAYSELRAKVEAGGG